MEKISGPIKLIHHYRFQKFSLDEIPSQKKYLETKRNSFLTLGVTIVLSLVMVFFSKYGQTAIRIAIFALIYNLYKIYQVYAIPVLLLNDKGIELRNVKIAWKKIRKIKPVHKSSALQLEIELMNGKLVLEKLENLKKTDEFYLSQFIRNFQKKYRYKFTFKIQ